MVTMLAYSLRLSHDEVDVQWDRGDTGRTGCEQMLAQLRRDRDVLPADQTIDVHFDEFMADDVAMVSASTTVARQPIDAAPRGDGWVHGRTSPGRFGTVEYDLPLFGLDRQEVHATTDFYTERFGVTKES